MRRPVVFLFPLLAALAAPALADTSLPAAGVGFESPAAPGAPGAGGFSGPMQGTTTVAQAKRKFDDSYVALRGHIEQHLGGDMYLFRDHTGTIRVEIDDEIWAWAGKTVKPTDKVEIYGEIDRDLARVEVDVNQLRLVR